MQEMLHWMKYAPTAIGTELYLTRLLRKMAKFFRKYVFVCMVVCFHFTLNFGLQSADRFMFVPT